jgi:hypothetical protein
MAATGTFFELLLVLHTLTQQPVPTDLPMIVIVSRSAMPCACEAAFDDEKLYLRNDINWQDPKWLSIVLHELAHYSQFSRNGPARDCNDWLSRERQAIEIQIDYLESVNSPWRPINSYRCDSSKF